MDFHGRFCFSEMGPGEQGKAEVYGRGIQCVDSVFNIRAPLKIGFQFKIMN